MYFKQQKRLCILLKMNIHAFTFSKVIFYFVSSSKQTHFTLKMDSNVHDCVIGPN